MKRLYEGLGIRHLKKWRQMLLLAGPRQVGKTTLAMTLGTAFHKFTYLNWDVKDHQELITGNFLGLEECIGIGESYDDPPLVVFDEIHKAPMWRDLIKGFFDRYERRVKIVLTGSARLDILRYMGDSLMGRYFSHQVHPLSAGELVAPSYVRKIIRPPQFISHELMDRLLIHGGFPEPYLQNDEEFSSEWKKIRFQQLFRQELTEVTRIRELNQISMLGELLIHQTGQLCNYANLANKLQVSAPTIKAWIDLLKAFYFCFTLSPFSKNIPRSLLKEPKTFLWDWSLATNEGARIENMMGCHLHKAVHHWNDCGMGSFELHYIRDKQKREVDFVVTRDRKPWILIEVKRSKNHGLSKSLLHFHKLTEAPHTFQLIYDMPYEDVDLFSETSPVIAPMSTFLSQLP